MRAFVCSARCISYWDGFDASDTKRVMDEIRGEGGEAEISVVDLTDFQAIRGVVDATFRSTGRLDILVHSAGGFPRSNAVEINAPVQL